MAEIVTAGKKAKGESEKRTVSRDLSLGDSEDTQVCQRRCQCQRAGELVQTWPPKIDWKGQSTDGYCTDGLCTEVSFLVELKCNVMKYRNNSRQALRCLVYDCKGNT